MEPAGAAHAWTPGHAGATFAMWVVMMAAMMLPASLPMIRMVATIARNRRAREAPYVPAAVFVAGYLAAWSAFSLAATLAQWALEVFARLDAMAPAPPVFAGLLLLGAGLYQATPLKARCLS